MRWFWLIKSEDLLLCILETAYLLALAIFKHFIDETMNLKYENRHIYCKQKQLLQPYLPDTPPLQQNQVKKDLINPLNILTR